MLPASILRVADPTWATLKVETVIFSDRWYLYINLQNAMSQKILIFFSIALRATYNATNYFFPLRAPQS
jgi:hypothetical protein